MVLFGVSHDADTASTFAAVLCINRFVFHLDFFRVAMPVGFPFLAVICVLVWCSEAFRSGYVRSFLCRLPTTSSSPVQFCNTLLRLPVQVCVAQCGVSSITMCVY